MNLQAILASRKGVKKVEVVAKKEEKEEEIDLDYKATTSYEEPEESIYLALYTPFIKNPYKFDWYIFKDYQKFLLEDKLYVLSTFSQLFIDNIFELYMKSKLKPNTLQEYTLLCYFLNHIHLVIPGKYQNKIEEIIRKIPD